MPLERFTTALLLLISGVLASATTAEAQDSKSKTPPPGAPWTTNFVEARALALEKGIPIFLYSTKTY